MSETSDEDAFIDAEIERAIAPYRAAGLSAEALAGMEQMLRIALTEHPAGQDLVSRLRPRAVDESGEVPIRRKSGPAKAGGAR